jgi:hypothetical protein
MILLCILKISVANPDPNVFCFRPPNPHPDPLVTSTDTAPAPDSYRYIIKQK